MDKNFVISDTRTRAESTTHIIYNAYPCGWKFTSLDNYNNRISDARKDLNFWNVDGFDSIEDVIEYVKTWF